MCSDPAPWGDGLLDHLVCHSVASRLVAKQQAGLIGSTLAVVEDKDGTLQDMRGSMDVSLFHEGVGLRAA